MFSYPFGVFFLIPRFSASSLPSLFLFPVFFKKKLLLCSASPLFFNLEIAKP